MVGGLELQGRKGGISQWRGGGGGIKASTLADYHYFSKI